MYRHFVWWILIKICQWASPGWSLVSTIALLQFSLPSGQQINIFTKPVEGIMAEDGSQPTLHHRRTFSSPENLAYGTDDAPLVRSIFQSRTTFIFVNKVHFQLLSSHHYFFIFNYLIKTTFWTTFICYFFTAKNYQPDENFLLTKQLRCA